jgi:molecular chaperone GrpE
MFRFGLFARPSLLSSGPRVAARGRAASPRAFAMQGKQQRWMSAGKAEPEVSSSSSCATEEQADTAAAAGEAEAGAAEAEESSGDALAAAEERVAELEAEAVDAKKKYMGVLAEMENVRRIAKNDVEKANTYSIQKFAKSLLPVSDNLGRALEAVPEASLADAPAEFVSLHEGIVMTEKDLMKVFAGNGIEKFGEVGDSFDPERYDAMFQYEDPDMETGAVGQVIMQGYSFKDRVLRPCQVGVVKE